MNQNILKGKWKQYRGKVQQQWGKLTDDDLSQAEGQRDQIVGKIQERYGVTRDEAEKQYEKFVSQF
ncbi:MAG: CsbD family protein [Trueperaceae bacterium]|nr:CsbD family protein [Trueperaceae bacterium]